MRLYPFPNTKAAKALFALLMALLLYICRDSMFTTALLGVQKAYLLTVGLVGISGAAFLVHNRKHVKEILTDGRMLLCLAAGVILILPMLVKKDWQLMYVSVLVCLYIGVFFSFFVCWKTAAKYYVLIMTAVGIYSVAATYLLRMLPDRGLMHVPVFYNSIGHMFHNFGFAIVSDEYVKMRNFGIFREPGVYQYFVLLALYLNNYAVIWKKERTMWMVNGLLSLTMLSTLATGGIVELGLLAIAVFFHKKLYKSKKAWICIGILVLVAGIAMAVIVAEQGDLYWTIYGSFVSKFEPGADSSSDRVDTIVENTKFFLSSPLVGGRITAVFDTVPNNTSSSTLMFAIFGILGGLLHAVSWVALVWDGRRSVFGNVYLLVILFMAFNTQNLIANVFLWLLPMMALCQRGLPLMKESVKKWKKNS